MSYSSSLTYFGAFMDYPFVFVDATISTDANESRHLMKRVKCICTCKSRDFIKRHGLFSTVDDTKPFILAYINEFCRLLSIFERYCRVKKPIS